MPPIAEDMGGTGGPPSLQPQQHQKKKSSSKQPPMPPPVAPQRQPQQPGQASRAEGQARQSSSGTALAQDEPEYDVEPPIAMMQVQTSRSSHHTRLSKSPSTMDQYSTDPQAATEFFKKEPCIHSHRMFDRAAKIFQGLKQTREAKMEARRRPGAFGATKASNTNTQPEIPPMDFKSPAEKKLTFELAFASLKYENIFEEMLEDCAFFSIYPDLRDSECLVMVVLWDYQSRKFQPRVQFDAGELVREVTVIEKAIMDQKTKLAASLARRRIKASAPNIEYLLPDKLRSKASAHKPLPVHAWVNTLKINPPEMLQRLKEEKLTQLWVPPKTAKDFPERSFYLDPHCSDLLVFSSDCHTMLQEHALVEQGYLVRQDKSSCLAAHSVLPLLSDEHEAIVVNPGSGLTAAHLAVLLKERKCCVVVVTEQRDEDVNRMLRNVELIGVTKYVKVIRENFVNLDADDHRLRAVRAALVIAECSKSAIGNIVNYIVTEGENLKLLQDMSDQTDEIEEKVNRLQADHVAMLRQALKIHKIQGVVYLTRSVHEQENDAVVQRAIEYVNMVQMAKKLRPWRVIPPVLPFSCQEIDDQAGIQGKHTIFQPSELMNGCFIVCIAREPEDPADVAARGRGGRVGGKSSKSKLKGASKTSSSGSSHPSDSTDSAKGRRKTATKKSKAAPKVSSPDAFTQSTRSRFTRSEHTSERVTPEYMRVVKHPAPFR